MRIGIHCNQFDGRGTGKVPFDYGMALRDILNHDVMFITSRFAQNDGLHKIQEFFPVSLYDFPPIHTQINDDLKKTKNALEDIVSNHHLDFIHMIKAGENDLVTPDNCKSGIHCVFHMLQPHGNVYAGVSEYVAKKYNKTDYVPHIIQYIRPTENYRGKYNIPSDAFVVGRHGGVGQFNVPFVKSAIESVLSHRKDIYFLFLSTNQFMEHERVIFIPWVQSEQAIFNFIDSCDAMLHARMDGETFGLAVGEFSVSNKPVMTWGGNGNPGYNKAHIDILGDKALIYNDVQELADLLFNIDKNFTQNHDWDKYSKTFCPTVIMKTYKETFLDEVITIK